MFRAVSSQRPRLWAAAYRGLMLPSFLRGPVYRQEGRIGGAEARIIRVGDARWLNYLLEDLTDSLAPGNRDGTASRWAASRLGTAQGHVTAVHIHPWASERFRRAGFLIVPQWVRWRGPLAEVPPPNPSTSLQRDLDKVRKREFRLEPIVRPGRAEWQSFVQEMLIPHTRSRFGDRTSLPSAAYMRQLESRSALLIVRLDGRRVGGVAVVPAGERVWMQLMGVSGGDPELIAQGTSAAIWVLTIEWARRSGYVEMDVGRTGPSLSEGLARYKWKFGFRPVADPLSPLVAIRSGGGGDGLVAALRRSRLVIEPGGGSVEPMP